MREHAVLILILIACGCVTQPTLVVKQSSDRRPATSPAGVVRTDGLYVCRGLKGIGSPGGLGFWPFASPATQLRFAEFLRFDASGRVSRWYGYEPVTVAEARSFLREDAGSEWAVGGSYTFGAGRVEFVLRGKMVGGGDTYSETPYAGIAYADYLALTIDEGESFPPASRYLYREYDFVPDPDAPLPPTGGPAERPPAGTDRGREKGVGNLFLMKTPDPWLTRPVKQTGRTGTSITRSSGITRRWSGPRRAPCPSSPTTDL